MPALDRLRGGAAPQPHRQDPQARPPQGRHRGLTLRLLRPEECPLITVDQLSSVPPYEQIRAQVAGEIADGTMPAGTRLPTVRKLAGDLGLAVNTVARAYRELESAGLVETRGRAGTVATGGGDRFRDQLRHAAAEYAQQAHRLGVGVDEARAIVAAALDAVTTG